jgi:hypothetical protein
MPCAKRMGGLVSRGKTYDVTPLALSNRRPSQAAGKNCNTPGSNGRSRHRQQILLGKKYFADDCM